MKDLEALPGKKVIVILDAPMRIPNSDSVHYERQMWDVISRFSDHAIRTGTTVYAFNVSGLQAPPMFDASLSSDSFRVYRPAVHPDYMHWIWEVLSRRTGGFLKSDNSFIVNGLRSTMRDLSAYYVLSFRPDAEAFTTLFNAIRVRIKRPGLTVRSAAGFYGIFPEDTRRSSGRDALAAALESPFVYQDLDVRLTSLFIGDQKNGSAVRSWMLLDARRLNFLDEGDGGKSASLEVQIGLYRTGIIPVRNRFTRSIYLPGKEFEKTLQKGYVFNIYSPSLPPGDYALRVAVMDRFTKRIGSAYQLVAVPDLKKKRFALSGILMADKLLADESDAQASVTERDPNFGPGVRRFKPGMKVQFACVVYHPPKDKKTGRPAADYQVRIIGEEGAVYTGAVNRVELSESSSADPLLGGELVLGAPLKSGTYMLELTVSEPGSKKKSKSAVQIIDFQME